LIFFVLKVTTAAYVTIREPIAVTSVKKLTTFFPLRRNSVLLLLTVRAAGPCLRQHIALIFFGNGTTHIISVLQEKQELGSVLHTTNDLRGSISSPILVPLENGVVIFVHIIEDH
jgi:hypothetical protein